MSACIRLFISISSICTANQKIHRRSREHNLEFQHGRSRVILVEITHLNLRTVFHEDYNQIVLLRNIPFHSICEHHFLPFVGHAHVAYLPNKRVVGLSKLARVVEGFALRPQVQERLTDQVADAIMDCLRPLGAICVIDASHTCMTIRGIKKPGSTLVTSSVRGTFLRNQATRNEVLNLIYRSSGL